MILAGLLVLLGLVVVLLVDVAHRVERPVHRCRVARSHVQLVDVERDAA